MVITIRSLGDIRRYLDDIDLATEQAMKAISGAKSPRDALRRMKFDQIGVHPIGKYSLNVIEQINQTYTYLVAFEATKWLLTRHPDAGGFELSPGAAMARPFDIVSLEPGLVAAETFAATHPDSNRKLAKDLKKLGAANIQYRYAFFHAPGFPIGRVERLERETGVEVHCVNI